MACKNQKPSINTKRGIVRGAFHIAAATIAHKKQTAKAFEISLYTNPQHSALYACQIPSSAKKQLQKRTKHCLARQK